MIKNHSLTVFTRLAAAATLVMVSLFQGGTVQAEPDFTGCGGGATIPVVNSDYEQQVLELVNEQRALVSAPPLKRNSALDNSARYMSEDMATDNYWPTDHGTYDIVNGKQVFVCAWDARVKTWYSGASNMGENIAAGYPTPAAVMSGWMNSPGHKANILSVSYREIGIGYYSGAGSYGAYWTQDFGTRGSVYPLIINRDAAGTDTRNVAIYIYGSWTQMRLHNDSDAPGAWQAFQQSFNWTLKPGVGVHTVTAELTAGSASTTTSDTITLTKDVTPSLGGLADSSGFIYSQADHKFSPASLTYIPADLAGGNSINWTETSQGAWFTAAPASGTTPGTITITPKPADTLQPGAYPGSLTVTVTSPVGTLNSPHVTLLTLTVVPGPLKEIYLPLVGQ